ncbi:MAG: D-alanyl-D-alanine carboxypeptidase/D-alanyl-D-alanine-endopeptidase [Gemmatimonadota bacterium]|nr:D-alanyl-D-alanine carboxypeptidase/D-alanyl-D-alanine-endopeptidase [Gemmatimonadota bacterium]MDH3368243.1 D-alanyl-D-alanine carboxypeptidase/D-alanyl-D-alanine-endopeptidase [Gemmatimonadota bacterium]MDH3478522.1 D-alanyl-D-alanine carboxypeptidase/D-alanyl-D-alanine-endopeptidase [Gemmatimonadota bacterium]MDH3571419.1 D-alanyl-D-alanine carboxypeptidase/D-alanyl-D-alanine-endopeptidase [Gemmatimonadota bacterium]MDH5548425.1 D-alanyl-D-alanine carboxypeptidase/D-alanyl-D-alanine-endop
MKNCNLRRNLWFLGASAALVGSAVPPLHAQGSPARRIEQRLARPPLDRAHWGILAIDERGRTLYEHNADRLFIPASTAKLVVAAAASALLPAEFRAITSVYAAGPITDGVLQGDLIIFGRGDPTFSTRCYGTDTLAAGACDSAWARVDTLADQLVARGIRRVAGAVVGDGSHFDPELTHPGWESYDLNWWYAAPVSGLGFNDNSLDVTYGPGPAVGAPVDVQFWPDLGLFLFENRTRTLDAGERRTIDFFREPGTTRVWAEGGVSARARPRTEYFAVPDPNLFFAAALREALARRGVSVLGPTRSTVDPALYASLRTTAPVAEVASRARDDLIYPILNSSQNWFAEMILKNLGQHTAGTGSWEAGLAAERRFLIDSVGVDSTAIALSDGSGLATTNLLTPRALVQILAYMRTHPSGSGFLRGLPRSGQPGSLRDRFIGTPLEGRVVAKTGSIARVNSLAGYVERPDGRTVVFAIFANNHTVPYSAMLQQIDSLVLELGR